MQDFYTIGEVFRLGLLKNHKGEPYKDKGTVSKIVSKFPCIQKNTPWGLGVFVPADSIIEHNNKWGALTTSAKER